VTRVITANAENVEILIPDEWQGDELDEPSLDN
jgi:hypothetical protein